MLIHDFPNLAPSVCFMCESCEDGTRFLDTLKNFDPGSIFVALAGRKYICENCVRDFAHAFGVFDAEKERHAEEVKQLTDHNTFLSEALAAYERIDAVVKQLAEAPKPPKKKPAKAEETS